MTWISWPMSLLETFLLFSWFIASSVPGTLVITKMLSMGDNNPPKKFRIIRGLGEGVVAATLLLSGMQMGAGCDGVSSKAKRFCNN